MYNAHRGMVPAPNSRLTELLDQLRQEFENQSRSTGEFEHQCVYTPFFLFLLSPSFGLFIRPFVANVWIDGHIDAVVFVFLGHYFASCAINYLSSSLVN